MKIEHYLSEIRVIVVIVVVFIRCLFFFFQAEDGIRDLTVTGVQTCALPISGQILWRSPLGASPNHLIWSSPAVYHDSVYVGVSSFDDCPLVQGKLVKVSA